MSVTRNEAEVLGDSGTTQVPSGLLGGPRAGREAAYCPKAPWGGCGPAARALPQAARVSVNMQPPPAQTPHPRGAPSVCIRVLAGPYPCAWHKGSQARGPVRIQGPGDRPFSAVLCGDQGEVGSLASHKVALSRFQTNQSREEAATGGPSTHKLGAHGSGPGQQEPRTAVGSRFLRPPPPRLSQPGRWPSPGKQRTQDTRGKRGRPPRADHPRGQAAPLPRGSLGATQSGPAEVKSVSLFSGSWCQDSSLPESSSSSPKQLSASASGSPSS